MTGVSLESATIMERPIVIIVMWIAPQNRVNISKYEVQYRRNGTEIWNTYTTMENSPLVHVAILEELNPGTYYNVRVRAIYYHRNGVWSVEHTERTLNG